MRGPAAVTTGMDTSTTEPAVVDLEPVTAAVVAGVVPAAELPGFFDRSFTRLAEVTAAQGCVPTGPAYAVAI